MNAQFQVAQASGTGNTNSSAQPRIFKLTKPLTDQAVVVNLGYDQKVQVDFTSIANEKITLVHVGEKLIILFDNKSTVTVEPFFDSRHDAQQNLTVEVAPGRDVSANEFASLFPITTDQSVLPAAGNGDGNSQATGAHFTDASVDPLSVGNPLPLLGQEELGNFVIQQPVASSPNSVVILPTAGFTLSGVLLAHDESAGVQSLNGANDQSNSALPPVFSSAGLIGWAQTGVSEIASSSASFGTSGTGTITYTLSTASGGAFSGVDSGLRATATGNEIFLFTEGNLVVGREGAGGVANAGGAIAFEIYLDPANQNLNVAQYEAIKHSVASDPDASEGAPLANILFIQQMVTDGLGNTASAVSSGSLGVSFLDDGPTISSAVVGSSVTLDETANGPTTDGVLNPAIMTATSAAAIVTLTSNFGADGAGTTSYALSVTQANSGLATAQGDHAITLVQAGATIEGQYTDVGGTHTAFVVSIGSDGKLTVVQNVALEHLVDGSTAAAYNDALGLAGKIGVTATVTDADGDTAVSGVIDVGGAVTFLDDGPTATVPEYAVLPNGAGSAFQFNLDTDVNLLNNYGADGPGTVRFAVTDGTNSGLTSGGATITYHLVDGQTLEGVANGATVFTVTLDPSTGHYSVDMNGMVDSFTTVNFSNGLYAFDGGNDPWAGFVPIGQKNSGTPVDDNSQDVLFTPFGTGTTINGNANSFGVGGGAGGQNIGALEGIRVDFVQDLTGNPQANQGGSAGYTNPANRDQVFDEHYMANGATFTFGDGQTDTVLQITAKDDNVTTGTDSNDVVGDGVLDSVSSIAITYDGETQIVNFAGVGGIGTTSTPFTVGNPGGLADRQYTVHFVDVDPNPAVTKYAVEITGVLDTHVSISTFTADGYNSLELYNKSGDDFAITGFGAAVKSTDPVSFSLPIEVVDGDGDTAASAIGVTLTSGQGIHDHSGTFTPITETADATYANIIGSEVADTLNGNGAANVLSGGGGNDTLSGGGGNDTLIGGTGNDTFVFNATAEGLDHILDFSAGDVLQFSHTAFGNLGAGTLTAANFDSNPTGTSMKAAGTPEFVFNETTHTLYYDADGGGAGVAIAMAKLENGHALTASEIHIV